MKIAHPVGQAVARELEKAAKATSIDAIYDEVEMTDPGPFALDARIVRPKQSATRHPIMLIGKAPAATEVETGKPLQGPAGQLLRSAAREAGLTIEDCHITHASPWRARKNNNPSPTQMAMSRPLLLREIELVAPRCIIVLGAKATDGLFGEHPTMSEDLHQQTEWNGAPVHIIRSHGFILRHRQLYGAYVSTLKTIIDTNQELLQQAA